MPILKLNDYQINATEDRKRKSLERREALALAKQLRKLAGVILPANMGDREISQLRRYIRKLMPQLRPALLALVVDGYALGLDIAKAEFRDFDPLLYQRIDWPVIEIELDRRANEWTNELTALVTANTDQRAGNYLREYYAELITVAQLREKMGYWFSLERAENIAVTEVTRSFNGSQDAAYRASGVVTGKQWFTANDDRVCEICAPMGGLTWTDAEQPIPATIAGQEALAMAVTLGESFIHPGGIGKAAAHQGEPYFQPPAHNRCRCRILPVF